MSCNPVWTVHCDSGDLNCAGWIAQEDTRRQARRTARANGWLVNHRDGSGWLLDYCPACRRAREL